MLLACFLDESGFLQSFKNSLELFGFKVHTNKLSQPVLPIQA